MEHQGAVARGATMRRSLSLAMLFLVAFGSGDIGLFAPHLFETKVLAQDQSVCTAVLQPDVTKLKSDTNLRLAWLKTIDVQRFRQETKNIDTGGSVIVYGIPMSGYGNYSQFSDARDREF
jgi:hypothetical protein